MICCVECFKDEELRSIVNSNKQKGVCEICGHKSVLVYDTEKDETLFNVFSELLDIYVCAENENIPNNYPIERKTLLKDELCNNWNIFNLSQDKIVLFLTKLDPERFKQTPNLLNAPVVIQEMLDEKFIIENSIFCTGWDEFATIIKHDNRFHIECLNEEKLKLFFNGSSKTFKKKSKFYRARISTGKELSKIEMGMPPHEKAKPGRLNPEGISCLYLSEKMETAVSEVRALANDVVAVAVFSLAEEIKVINMIDIVNISPFQVGGDNIAVLALNKIHLKKMAIEISRPQRRNDSVLDYLPTQYISDYIKSINEYDGIMYESTIDFGGKNLAIFSMKKFKCKSIDIKEIERVTHQFKRK